VSAYLANAGRKVTVVFETADTFLAYKKPLPDFIRKSRPDSFHGLAQSGKIKLVAPARATGFGDDGRSVALKDGRFLPADVVILATGFKSSWASLFDAQTGAELGISRHSPSENGVDNWNYTSLANPPMLHLGKEQWSSSMYRGLVPAKNINKRDFAINGAVFTANNGYAFEVCAHWISSYFLGDRMRLPSTAEEALASAERNSAWMRKRYPSMLPWVNESYSSNLAFWTDKAEEATDSRAPPITIHKTDETTGEIPEGNVQFTDKKARSEVKTYQL
ncbi:hypothetical protein C0992_001783, partial [Termitomyces sp. T32_za158]